MWNDKPDGYPKPDGYGYEYEFLPVGTGINFYPQPIYWWTGNYSTRSKPDPLPSLTRTPDWPLCLAYRARTPFGTVGPVLGARSSRVPLPCPGLLLPPQHPASSARTCSTRTKSALTGLASQAARSSPPVAARPPERSRAHWPPRRRPTAPRTHRPDRTTVPTKPRAARLLKAFPGQHFVPSPTLFRRR
jgi:hypothetical protein